MNTDQNNIGTSNFLNFSDALNHLRWGERVARRTWGNEYITLDYDSSPNHILFFDEYGYESVWNPSSRMILAEDWYVLGEYQ